MRWLYLAPVALGLVSVLQAGLNRKISGVLGLPGAVLLNSAVLLLVAALAAVALQRGSHLPAGLSAPAGPWRLAPWFLLPGLFGFLLVFGLPYALARLGAGPVFILLIGSQVVSSLAWDALVEGRGVPPLRLAGAGLAVLGGLLSIRR